MRLHRMRGRNTLWICGTDHASIAVHAVIEKQLRAEGTTRLDVGREAFVERVWEWRRETGATIIQQLKRLGCTLDYEHERFTMDEGYVRAVMEMFVRLYDKGLIYRDNRIVNWCPGCGSTVSDLEVRHERAADALYEVRYPITGTDRVPDRGDRAARDDPGRHGRGRAPGRRPLPPPGRQDRDRADRRPRGADHRRRLREDGLRHRRAQGHARPRPQRLRDRAPPRAARDLGDRVRRPHVGRGRRVRRAGRGRGPPEGDRPPVQRAAAARRAALRARGRPLRPHRRPHRAADLAAVVHADGLAGGRRQRRGALGQRPLRAQEPGGHLLPLDGQHPALVHLPPALVGPPDPGLVLPGRAPDRERGAAGRLR